MGQEHARRESIPYHGTAHVNTELPLLVHGFVGGKRVPSVEGVVLEEELGVTVPRASAATRDDFGSASSAARVTEVFGGERIVVDAHILGLRGRPFA